MRVDAFLADSAEVVQNKIYALGAGWNIIFVRGFPAVHRRLSVGAIVHVPFTETNRAHQFELKLLTEDGVEYPIGIRPDEDGKPAPVRAMGGEFTVGRPRTSWTATSRSRASRSPSTGSASTSPACSRGSSASTAKR
ncbi:hypothetical protein GCM10025873_04880 [Demequina sediminis]|nr:hypothetical protein [Demequina sediminis]BDZ60697.1 hypothetical protein GCM10025873_04880 [Demequina sediminis]